MSTWMNACTVVQTLACPWLTALHAVLTESVHNINSLSSEYTLGRNASHSNTPPTTAGCEASTGSCLVRRQNECPWQPGSDRAVLC